MINSIIPAIKQVLSKLSLYVSFFTKNVNDKAQNDSMVFRSFTSALDPYIGKVKEKTILDIGCGRLFPLSRLFTGLGNKVTGIDTTYIGIRDNILKRLIKYFTQNGLASLGQEILFNALRRNKRFCNSLSDSSGLSINYSIMPDIRQMNAEKMDFSDKYFDVVISNAAFEHIADISAVLAQIKRVLRSSGLICVRIDLWPSLTGGHNPDWDKQVPWYHLRSPFQFHDFLNRLKKSDYLSCFSKYFDILNVLEEKHGRRQLLTDEIRKELSMYSEDDLFTQCITIIAKNN
jgi:SAM-dependent methyltransferase